MMKEKESYSSELAGRSAFYMRKAKLGLANGMRGHRKDCQYCSLVFILVRGPGYPIGWHILPIT